MHNSSKNIIFIHGHILKQLKGFGLIELLVTLILISITFLGLMRLQSTLVYAAVDNAQRSIGIFIGNEILDRMRANTGAFSSYQAKLATPACATVPAACGSANNCSAAQIAARDVWEVMCVGSASGVSNLQANLNCNGACTQMGQNASLTISWSEKTSANSATVGSIVLSTRL